MSEQNQTVENVSAEEGKFGQGGLLDPQRAHSGPTMSQLRGSRASISAPTKERVFNPYATNPARIPTAGGVAVGSRQYEARRASRVSQDLGSGSKSPPQSPPPISEEGAAESSKDGAINGEAAPPAGGDTPAFNMPSYEDKDSVAPDAHAPTAQATEGAPAQQNETVVIGNTPGEDKPSTMEKVKETVTDKLPGTTGGTEEKSNTLTTPTSPGSPGSPSKERRGSRFDAFKHKLGLDKDKK